MHTIPLKKVGRLSTLLGTSPLSKSPIWHQNVCDIDPVQLHVFVARHRELGQKDMAETAIDIAQSEIQQAVARKEIPIPKMLSYKPPIDTYITMSEFESGLAQMSEAQASAVVFALEAALDSIQVAMLTWRRLALMGELSETANGLLEGQPRHLHTPYVFWEYQGGMPMPVFGLDAVVFEVFGLVWAELTFGYRHLIVHA